MSDPVARRQLTAFLPRPVRDDVERVRRRWDPIMSHQIDAHFTICHDLRDPQLAQLDILRRHPTMQLRIGGVRCWGQPALGIYLEVENLEGALDKLRDSLGIESEPGLPFSPHVTLTHPRTTTAERAEKAWVTLSAWRLDCDIEVDTVDVIEHDGTRWSSTSKLRLGRTS